MILHGIEDPETGMKYVNLDEVILYLTDCEDEARDNVSSFNTIAAEVYRDLRKSLIKYRTNIQGKAV